MGAPVSGLAELLRTALTSAHHSDDNFHPLHGCPSLIAEKSTNILVPGKHQRVQIQ